MYLEGNTKEDLYVTVDRDGYPAGSAIKPWWLTSTIYFLLTALGAGWLVRMYLYWNTLQCNYYLKKVIIK